MEGVVKFFNDSKGFGFIVIEGGENIFVHHSVLDMEGYKTLKEGDRVIFEIEKGRRGREARNVRLAD